MSRSRVECNQMHGESEFDFCIAGNTRTDASVRKQKGVKLNKKPNAMRSRRAVDLRANFPRKK